MHRANAWLQRDTRWMLLTLPLPMWETRKWSSCPPSSWKALAYIMAPSTGQAISSIESALLQRAWSTNILSHIPLSSHLSLSSSACLSLHVSSHTKIFYPHVSLSLLSFLLHHTFCIHFRLSSMLSTSSLKPLQPDFCPHHIQKMVAKFPNFHDGVIARAMCTYGDDDKLDELVAELFWDWISYHRHLKDLEQSPIHRKSLIYVSYYYLIELCSSMWKSGDTPAYKAHKIWMGQIEM